MSNSNGPTVLGDSAEHVSAERVRGLSLDPQNPEGQSAVGRLAITHFRRPKQLEERIESEICWGTGSG